MRNIYRTHHEKLTALWLIVGIIACLFISMLLLSSCDGECDDRLYDVTVISVGGHESEWRCGDQGSTILEFPDGTRQKFCGQLGKVGDHFKSRKYCI